jgi:ribonuclease HI
MTSGNPSSNIASSKGDGRLIVQLFTDGACIGNPGPGGWAFLLRHPASGRCKEGSGGEHHATNNRMEVTAVIRGLEALKAPSRVDLFSDSDYVVKAVSEWMRRWKRFGWRKSAKATRQVRNADLWQRLDELLQTHAVTAQWVRGHVGHPENERCDQLATAAAAMVAATPAPPMPICADIADVGLFANAAPAEEDDE